MLEEFALFCIAVAGKNARRTARSMDAVLKLFGYNEDPEITAKYTPFQLIQRMTWLNIGEQLGFNKYYPEELIRTSLGLKPDQRLRMSDLLKFKGIGCHHLKGNTMVALATLGLDLNTCTVDQLDDVIGIGPKTARYFILHTRKDVRLACLDTHILKWMGSLGLRTPNSTPSGNRYIELEKAYLGICKLTGYRPVDLDIAIWLKYSDPKNKSRPYIDIPFPSTETVYGSMVIIPTKKSVETLLKTELTLSKLIRVESK
jgi:hypothetical protein